MNIWTVTKLFTTRFRNGCVYQGVQFTRKQDGETIVGSLDVYPDATVGDLYIMEDWTLRPYIIKTVIEVEL